MSLSCLYIDFDAFFANVEKQLDSRTHNNAIGVTSLPSDQATLITCCYAAKAHGVRRGMRVYEARQLCPDIVIKPARHDVYVQMHNHIIHIIDRHLPIVKAWSIDEMECRLMGREQDNAIDIAKMIRADLAHNIGPLITPSIGLASNGFLAKVAAEMHKPRGLTALRAGDLPQAIAHLQLSDLPGISTGMQARLERANIHSILTLWDIAPKQARAIWGNVEGERFWRKLHGETVITPPTSRRMFGHSRILSRPWQTPDRAFEALRLLTCKAAYRMRREGYTAGRLSIRLKTTEGGYIQRETTFPACRDDISLIAHSRRLFEMIRADSPPRLLIQTLYIMLSDIVRTGQRSGDLFSDPIADPRHNKWDAATTTMDSLNEKYGKAVIHVGTRPNLPGGYAGAKIAFGRIPDKRDFF